MAFILEINKGFSSVTMFTKKLLHVCGKNTLAGPLFFMSILKSLAGPRIARVGPALAAPVLKGVFWK